MLFPTKRISFPIKRVSFPIKRVSALGALLAGCSGGVSPTGEAAPAGQNPPPNPVASVPGATPNETPSNTPSPTSPGTPPTVTPPPAGSTAPATVPTPPTDCSAVDTSETALRRLSQLEYQFTLEELFHLPSAPDVNAVPKDSDFKGFRTLAALQTITTEHLRAYQTISEKLATELLTDAPRLEAVVGCDLAAQDCLQTFVTEFGRLAYRRTLETDEVAAYLALAAGYEGSAEDKFVTVVSALLSSPSFLYRVEVGDKPQGTELSTLTGEELAARLSFALIGRGPSKELLDQGKSGGLDSAEGLRAATQALLTDPRSQEFYDAFFQQWLGFEQLRAPKEPAADWNDALMLSMQEETHRFLRDYAWTEGANFLDSFTANHTFIRADLAEYYHLPPPAENGYVEFPEDHDRAHSGLLTHAALLAAKRDGDRIAHRGAWVQSTFLCIDLQVPTALLDSISDELAGLTFNQIFERRNSDEACAGCHALIDPIGVGLAPYDESGRFDASIDLSQFSVAPALPQAQTGFSNAGELAELLRDRAEFANCLTSKLFLYAGGREAASPDACTIKRAADQFVTDQYRFASVLEGLVTSPDFRVRRAPAATAAEGEN